MLANLNLICNIYIYFCNFTFSYFLASYNFPLWLSFYISNIFVKKYHFWLWKVFFKIKTKNIHLIKKIWIKIWRAYLKKQFYIITIFLYLAYFSWKKYFLHQNENLHFIKKCHDENLYTLFKQTILHYNVFSMFA